MSEKEIDVGAIYFAAGKPWVKHDEVRSQARCPIYCYGVDHYGWFVFDTSYAGACTDEQAMYRAHEIAVRTAMALTLAARAPGFNVARFAQLIEGQV